MAEKNRAARLASFLRTRGVRFWSGAITAVSILVLFTGSQIAHDRGQTVEWYAGFGGWLGALGSFVAAGAALWIATSDRRRADDERRRVEDQQENTFKRQAGLVRVTAEMLGRAQPVGPSIGTPAVGIRNRRAETIFDVDVVKFVHGGQELDLAPEPVNGFTIFPPRPSQGKWYYHDKQLKGISLEPDEWLVIYQQGTLPGTPAEYAAVRYTDRAGARWEVDTLGEVTRC